MIPMTPAQERHTTFSCPNPDCQQFNRPNAGNIGHRSWTGVVYLRAADKYRRLTHRLPKDQKGLKERVLMASQQLSHPWWLFR